jgi:mono/diheme cytochrome c family protein
MRHTSYLNKAIRGLMIGLVWWLGGCDLPEPPKADEAIPSVYANLHMPDGWWTDKTIIEDGRQLYLGLNKSNVNCAQCHGKTGKPVMTAALSFLDVDKMKRYSDSQLLWRVSEGVPYSRMGAYKDKLSQDEIWKVIAFVGSLGMDGLRYDPKSKSWIPTQARPGGNL